jgi:hypothetical protein
LVVSGLKSHDHLIVRGLGELLVQKECMDLHVSQVIA